MIKLELDWAADESPVTGVVSETDDSAMLIVEYDDVAGPAGWPIVRLYATTQGAEYLAFMAVDGWLRDVYGCDEQLAQEMAGLAEVV